MDKVDLVCCKIDLSEAGIYNKTEYIIYFDIFWAVNFFLMIFVLILGWCGGLDVSEDSPFVTKDPGLTKRQYLEMYTAVILVFLPVIAMLAYKLKRGLVCMHYKTKVNFHSYYFASQVYYATFIT